MNSIKFNIEQLNRLFPFYFLVNRNLEIVSHGNSLSKIIPLKTRESLQKYIDFKSPLLPGYGFEDLLGIANQPVLLEAVHNRSITLQGQLEYLTEENQVLFIGSPNFSNEQQFESTELNSGDFAAFDVTPSLFKALQTKDNLTQRVKTFLGTIRTQKNELNKLSLLAEETVNGVIITDKEGRIEWTNKGFEKITGYTLQEIKGKKPGSFLQGEESAAITQEYLRTQIKMLQPFICEIINYNKNGSKYWVRINGQPIYDNNGNHTGFFAVQEDITQEREGKIKLLHYEERFRIALEKIGDNVWVHDYETGKTEFSKNDTDFLGYDLSDSENNAALWWKCIHEDDRWMLEQNDKSYRSGSIDHHNLEYRIIHKSGKIKWVLDRGIVFEYKNNAPTKIIGTHTDITQLKQSEAAFQEQKKFYETILNNIPADIAVFDTEHRYLFVNPRAIKNKEVRNWIIGKKDEDYISLRNKPRYILAGRRALFNEVHQTKKLRSWEEELMKPDGTKEYILRNMYPHLNEDKEVELIIGYGVDITQRKRFEERLQLSEARYKNLIDNSLALITTHNLDGILTMVNPMVCKVFGYKENEIVGHSLAEFMPPSDISNLQASYLDVIRSKKQANGVFRLLNRGGNIIYILYNNFLLEEPGKEPYVISYAVDITDRIKIEKELKMAKKETEDAAIAKERFLANMSHEIRTPMNGILGITSFLAKTELSLKQREYINLIRESTGNLLVILNDVLDLEKIIAGKLDFETTPFNLSEKIKSATESCRYKAEEKELLLEFKSLLPENLFVEGDPHRLSQILLNLISNAVKFTEKGSITVSAKVNWEENDNIEIGFSITDTGIGIAKDKLVQIFDPFVQAKADISRKYGGTGLGLSICKNLIEMQKGSIEVTSEENKGSIFSFSIPYKKTTENVLEEQIEVNHAIMQNKRILVAEDVEINQYVMKSTLDAWGCITTIVENGKRALEEVKKQDFDIVLMDVQMPEMNGFEATQAIRGLSDKQKASLPIIAVTANSLDGISERYTESGMNDYILKPFEEHRLFAIMEKYLPVQVRPGFKKTSSTSNKSLYDTSYLNTVSGGNKEFIVKMAEIFTRTAPVTFAAMKKARAINDWQELSREAHKLKSSINSMGIEGGKDLIKTIEERCKDEKELETIDELIDDFEKVLQASIDQLKKDYFNT